MPESLLPDAARLAAAHEAIEARNRQEVAMLKPLLTPPVLEALRLAAELSTGHDFDPYEIDDFLRWLFALAETPPPVVPLPHTP